MDFYKAILKKVSEELEPTSKAVFITGSVARGEATLKSDLDVLVITNSDHSFEEKVEDGVVVEIKKNTLQGFLEKMEIEPMNLYQWLDAIVIFDPENLLPQLKERAQKALDNYVPADFPKKWLESGLTKIESAKEAKNDLLLGFNVSNIVWKIVDGLYSINSLPTPPSTTSFRRIKTLENLPENFDELWSNILVGDLDSRTQATVNLIRYILKQNDK